MDMVRSLGIRVSTLDNIADLLELMADAGLLDQAPVKEATGHIDRAVQVLRRMQKDLGGVVSTDDADGAPAATWTKQALEHFDRFGQMLRGLQRDEEEQA